MARLFRDDADVAAVTGLVTAGTANGSAAVFEAYGGFGRGYRREWTRGYRFLPGLTDGISSAAGALAQVPTWRFRTAIFQEIGYFDPALDVGTPPTVAAI